MTNLEAIKGKVGYPLSDNSFLVALEERTVIAGDTFVPGSQSFDLAYADLLVQVITAPQTVSEGGFSIGTGDRQMLRAIADKIYSRYGEGTPLVKSEPRATFRSIM